MKLFLLLLLGFFTISNGFADEELGAEESGKSPIRSRPRIVQSTNSDAGTSNENAENEEGTNQSTVAAQSKTQPDINSSKDNYRIQFQAFSADSRLVSKRIVGANFLYWVQKTDDQDLAKYFKNVGIKDLRYPGGTVADNYLWDKNSLIDPDAFPTEKPGDAEKRPNYKDFLKYTRVTVPDAVPHFVVNVEGAFSQDDGFKFNAQRVRKWAKYAASWVKEVKDSGYKVEYWEIGNELYFHPVVGASDYAEVLKIYAEEMRAVDPNIKIGAVGPGGVKLAGFKDHLTPGGLNRIANLSKPEWKKLKQKLGGKDDLVRYLNDQKVPTNIKNWWGTLASEAPKAFDFIILHEYNTDRGGGDYTKKLSTFDEFSSIEKLVEHVSQDKKQIAVTEWNVCDSCEDSLSEAQIALTQTEIFLAILQANVKIANFWPVSFGSKASLISNVGNIHNSGVLYQKLAEGLQDKYQEVKLLAGDPDLVDYFASASANGKWNVIITYRGSKETFLNVGNIESLDDANQFAVDSDGVSSLQKKLYPKSGDNSATITLRPSSVTILSGKWK